MDVETSAGDRVVPFKRPKRFLTDLTPEITAQVVASAADVALIIDHGVIKDIALANTDLARGGYDQQWRGKRWIETVTSDSRAKIEDLLTPGSLKASAWRQVNHPGQDGADIPIRYSSIRLGDSGRIVAIGRDLRSIAAMQQRLVDAHQRLERDYERLRDTEARYRLLFQSVSEPVLIVEADNYQIEEANPAAARLLSSSQEALAGRGLTDLAPKKSQRLIESAIAEAMASGNATSKPVALGKAGARSLRMSAFELNNAVRLIVQIGGEPGAGLDGAVHDFSAVLETLPDALVVTDARLKILHANSAFSDLVRLTGARPAVGRMLDDFLCRSGTEVNVLMSNLRNHSSVRNFATVLRDRYGAEDRVEVSAVAAPSADGDLYGFSIRNVSRRLESGPRIGERLPSSVDQLTSLVGKVPMKEIVRESSDLIEKLCIEAALEITDDNRASAAEMLGLSRQGLYSKLKRFGIEN